MRDKLSALADEIAHGATSSILDLGENSGPGREYRLEFIGSSDLAGATGILVEHDDADDLSGASNLIEVTDAGLANNIIGFTIPSCAKRYIQASLVGTTSAGTWSLNVVLDAAQTNM